MSQDIIKLQESNSEIANMYVQQIDIAKCGSERFSIFTSVSVNTCILVDGITCTNEVLIDTLTVTSCVFDTYDVCVNVRGLLKGSFKQMYKSCFQLGKAPLHQDTLCVVHLGNLRITDTQGNYAEVLDFSSSRYVYCPVEIDDTVELHDLRGIRAAQAFSQESDHEIYNLRNFDLDMFTRSANCPYNRSTNLVQLALSCGDLV